MKECPACRRCFPDHVNHCPNDGDATTPSIAGEPILDGRYQLEKRLGQGGMGVVFKARHIFLKTAHAIKVILPDLVGNDPMLVTRFRQEALAAAAIRHQNIIAVTDFGVARGTMPFLVMEFVEGKSLHDILVAEGALPPTKALDIMAAIGAGMAAAHRQNIVHRDLKPLNIMMQNGAPISEAVKILDFGLAKIKSGELLGSFVQAKTSGLMGSPFYMAPEQWSDEEPDVRADIYSLGVILYQMLGGDVPFKGTGIPSIMKKHLTAAPPTFSSLGVNVPPAIEAVVRHALEKDADNRPQSVDAFIGELRDAVAQASASLNRTQMAEPAFQSATIISPPPSISMRPQPPATTTMRIRTSPPKARISINNIEIGTSDAQGQMVITDIQAGKHLVRVMHDGFAEWERQIDCNGGTCNVEAQLQSLMATSLPQMPNDYSGSISASQLNSGQQQQSYAAMEAQRLRAQAAALDEQVKREEAQRREQERREQERREQEERDRIAREEIQREEEARRLRAQQEARERAEAEARKKAEEEARLKAQEEARRLAEQEAQRRTEEARKLAEAEAQRRAEEEAARKKAEAEAQRRAEEAETARRQAEAEAAARRKAEEEAAVLRAEQEASRRRAQEEAQQRAEEDRRRAEAEAQRRAEEERQRQEQERMLAQERERVERERREFEEQRARLAATTVSPPPDLGQTQPQRQGVTTGPVNSMQGAQSMPGAQSQPNMGWQSQPQIHTSMPGYAAEPKKSGAPVAIIAAIIGFIVLVGAGGGIYFMTRPSAPTDKPPTPGQKPGTDNPGSPDTPKPPDLVAIPGGTFQMGRSDGPTQESPPHTVTVGAFQMDKTEVTNAEYAQFVKETGHAAPSHFVNGKPTSGQENWPVVNVTLQDAKDFAAWRSKRDGVTYRLPTEEEWEFAARNGDQNSLYPWGSSWEQNRAVTKDAAPESLKPVGSQPDGKNKWGVVDLIGNAWEWTGSRASFYPGGKGQVQPEQKDWYIIRGGSILSDPKGDKPISSTYRDWIKPTTASPYLGFRLVRGG